MQVPNAKGIKHVLGQRIDLARTRPVAKHQCPVMAVAAIEEHERPKASDAAARSRAVEKTA
jgi:hypothetical protein